MQVKKFLAIAFLTVIWWIALWGLIETIIQQFIRGSVKKAIMVYISMMTFVVAILYLNPSILEHFV